MGIGYYVFRKFFAPLIIGKENTEHDLRDLTRIRKRSLDLIELKLQNQRYLCGDKISIADLSAACEIENHRFMELDLSPWPKLKQWLYRVVDEEAVVLEVHGHMRQFSAAFVKQYKEQ